MTSDRRLTDPIPDEMRDALRVYIVNFHKSWKQELRLDFLRARYRGVTEEQTVELQRFRNQFGPRRLENLTIDDVCSSGATGR